MQLEQLLSPSGLPWYLSAVRKAALVAALARPQATMTGIIATAAESGELAAAAYEEALKWTSNPSERRDLEEKIRALR